VKSNKLLEIVDLSILNHDNFAVLYLDILIKAETSSTEILERIDRINLKSDSLALNDKFIFHLLNNMIQNDQNVFNTINDQLMIAYTKFVDLKYNSNILQLILS